MSSSVSVRRAAPSRSRRRSASRWVLAFVAVTALHWVAAQWFERHRDLPQPAPPAHVPVQIALLKPQRIERRAAPPAAARAAPHAPRTPHAAAPKPHEAPRRTLTAIARDAHPAVPAQPAPAQSASTPAAAAGSSAPAAHNDGAGNTPSAPAGPASHGVKFSVPPSGELQYDTFYNGMRNQPGTIHWSSDGQRYEMVVSVPLPFIGTFSWTSRGHVDAFGLAPDQYAEKRGHRPEDVTVFDRKDKQIVFTRTPNSLPLPDGAQDRFSMVMQLASLVRGDPDAYRPGVTREFFVADDDSGETWPVTTIGDESVSTDHGYVSARHFMRLPRRDGDRRRIDVWLAPSLGWLPVRLVQTEPNGTQFELVWRGPLTVPAAQKDAGAAAADTADTADTARAASAVAPASAAVDAAPPPNAGAPGTSPTTTPNVEAPATSPATTPNVEAPTTSPATAPNLEAPTASPATTPNVEAPATATPNATTPTTSPTTTPNAAPPTTSPPTAPNAATPPATPPPAPNGQTPPPAR